MQNDFQVVDHEIEHDADVGAAIRERRKPMRFDETRMGQPCFERAQDRIETLDVTDLQNELALQRPVPPVRSPAPCFPRSAFRSADVCPSPAAAARSAKCELVGVAIEAASTKSGEFLERICRREPCIARATCAALLASVS